MEQKKIVIIGAGVVGSSLAYFLSKLGQNNITVIEQGPLFETGGSTSHAPGLVFQLNFSKLMTVFANQTVEVFQELNSPEFPTYHPVGSIELANTPERLEDLKRKAGVAKSWGVEAVILSPDECAKKNPLLDPTQILGGLYVSTDGIAKPLRAVDKMAEFSKSCGVQFYGRTEVTDVEVINNQVKAVETTAGRFEADIVICCAGFWGPRIGEMVGVSIPLQPMAHQYVVTEDLPELANETDEISLPMLRHQDSALYYRQLFNGIGIGSYQHRPLPVEVSNITKYGETKDMPSVKPFTQEDFEKPWQDAQKLLPTLKETGFKKGINGIFSFTPDGMPLLGESKVQGFWVAEAIWVTHSAGIAKSVAEWIVNGAPTLDLELCDINRFDTYAQSPFYYKSRSIENYATVYDIHHPYEASSSSRDMRLTPYFGRQKELGGVFNEKSGWEQPQWYMINQTLLSSYEKTLHHRTGWAAKHWSPIVEAEQLHAKAHTALFDVTAEKKRLEISGKGVIPFLQQLTTSNIDIPIGQVTKTLMLHELGGIKDELTVIRLDPAKFTVLCSGATEASWIEKKARSFTGIQIVDLSSGTCELQLIGPKAKFVVDAFDQVFAEPNQAKAFYIGTANVHSYFTKLGDLELYSFTTTSDQGLTLWDELMNAGDSYHIVPAGKRALEHLRIEAFSVKCGKDYWSEHDPFEIGLESMVDVSKTDFIGKTALITRQEQGPNFVSTKYIFDDPSIVVMGYEPVFVEDQVVGFVTSAGYSYELGRCVMIALVNPAVVNKPVQIEYFGQRYDATSEPSIIKVEGVTR
ncbi:FAD-dependent oxidoreductase [Bacillaceae bacterium CLA-AA-H227]|uniref:FAD-dependent oxidoreductase n=1 Tax=Robertmurraya yapensis (ex Hitch et al 2024) TaxID=3133160 RepID=A0ACC6SB17_9BACI